MTTREKNKLLKQQLSKLLGKRTNRKRDPHQQKTPPVHPIRFHSLGKSKTGSRQGVAGWRSEYHRPTTVVLDGSDYREQLKYNH